MRHLSGPTTLPRGGSKRRSTFISGILLAFRVCAVGSVALAMLPTHVFAQQTSGDTDTPTQTGPTDSADAAQEAFRQQDPVGPTTGDARQLARRIMSATQYVVTPGDVYELQVRIGNLQKFPLLLQEDLLLEVPFIGTIDVRDMLFSQVRQTIVGGIKARVPAEFVSFELAAPALFDVFVFGGVRSPGIYTATPLSRMSDIITVAGGPQRGASLRRVELIREGEAAVLDLTRFSTLGELDANPTVEPGDRIRVPRVEHPVIVRGEVHFPGTFDLLAGETLGDAILFAGGSTQSADLSRVRVVRPSGSAISTIRAGADDHATFQLNPGDVVQVPALTRAEAMVTVRGALFGKPVSGNDTLTIPTNELLLRVPFRDGMTVLSVLDALGGPTPLAAPDGAAVVRADGSRVPVDLPTLWSGRSEALDLPLAAGDDLHVPMQNLFVYVGGEVNSPLAVPYVPSFTVANYIRAAGGPTEDAGNRFTLIGTDNQRRPVTDDELVEPGASVVVARNLWGETKKVLANLTIIAAFITTVVSVYDNIANTVTPP